MTKPPMIAASKMNRGTAERKLGVGARLRGSAARFLRTTSLTSSALPRRVISFKDAETIPEIKACDAQGRSRAATRPALSRLGR